MYLINALYFGSFHYTNANNYLWNLPLSFSWVPVLKPTYPGLQLVVAFINKAFSK